MGPTPQCQPGRAPPQRADRDKRRRTRPTQATEARDKPHPCQPPVPLGVRRQIKQRAPWLISYRACMVSLDRGGGASTPRASLSTRPSKAGTQLAEEGSSDGDRRSETTKNPTSSADENPGGGVRVDGPRDRDIRTRTREDSGIIKNEHEPRTTMTRREKSTCRGGVR